MGNECKNIQSHPLASDFSIIQPLNHPALGPILYLKSEQMRIEKAVNKIQYAKDHYGIQKFRERVELMKECESVSTLVKIYDYDVIDAHSDEAGLWSNIPSQSNCEPNDYPFILMHFQYLPPENTLSYILQTRLAALVKHQKRLGNELTGKVRTVKLYDYIQIDILQSQERQLVNCFYQEIEVVRMIDHLIGALFFLHHYDIPHGAVRPDCVLVDQEGKYLLVDRELFKRTTNYNQAQVSLKTHNKEFQFIAPEWILDLNQECQSTFCDHQKSDIFCVALLAIRMCLVDTEDLLFSYNFQSRSIYLQEQVIEKWMSQIRERYSPEFCFLLSKMLQCVPEERIDFAELIDQLNPILAKNLMGIKELYNPKAKEKKNEEDESKKPDIRESQKEISFLKASLISMEERFQRVMNNRTLLLHKPVDQKVLREQEQKILSKLRHIQLSKTAFQSTTARKPNPELNSPVVNYFNVSYQKPSPNPLSRHLPQDESETMIKQKGSSVAKEGKRYVSGRQLEAIVWKEYEDMKSRRSPK